MSEEIYFKPCLDCVERRHGRERREYSLLTVMRSFSGRRALGRRTEDQVSAYVDRFGPGILLLSLVIITLSCTDAVFTLHLINAGTVYELNPLMRWSMDQCVYFFLWLKIGLTAFGLFVLLGLKNFYAFNRIKVSHILYCTLIVYALLIKYEVWLHTV